MPPRSILVGRLTLRVAFSLALLVAAVAAPLLFTAQANPVPYPAIKMPYEYIYANITVTDESAAFAEVNGTYPFENMGYQNISMSYPLPNDATNVSVWIDENMTSWWYTSQTYTTVFGDLPVINWTIEPVPDTFTVEVDYAHSVPIQGNNFTYFYAMGTWKGVYAKQMTAYVTADITMDSIGQDETLEICAYQILLNSTTQEWTWKRTGCSVSRINNTFHVAATVQSDMFSPIESDFLLTFSTKNTVPEFPSLLILPAFMLVALLAVIVYKRKYS